MPSQFVSNLHYLTGISPRTTFLSPFGTNRKHQVQGLVVSVSYVLRNSLSLVGKNITVVGILFSGNRSYILRDEIAGTSIDLNFSQTNTTATRLSALSGWKCLVEAVVRVNPIVLEVHKLIPRNQVVPSVSPQIASQTNQTVTNSISYALNWAGYVVSDASVTPITSVYGAWSVPTVNPASPKPGYSSTWIGIGGYGSSDLIQTGTEQEIDCTSCSPIYYAWYELLPAGETYLFNIHAGDSISAQIQYKGSNSWYISISDTTIGCPSGCWGTTISYTSSFSSTEWIHEAPSSGGILPLAKTSDAYFTGGRMTGSTGSNSLGNFNTNQVLMVDNSYNVKAEPGCLPSPDRFDVSYTYDLSQEPPILTGCSFYPATVNAGTSFTAQYTINDPNSFSVFVGLGAAIRQSSTGGSIVDATHENVISVAPGTGTYSRQLSTLTSLPTASYDWQVSLWTGSPRTTNQYTTSGWRSGGLQILQQIVVSTDKSTYTQGDFLQYTGSGLTVGGLVYSCLSTDNDGSLLCTSTTADGSGNIAWSMQVGTNIPAGPQKFIVEDVSTSRFSNPVQLTILALTITTTTTSYSTSTFTRYTTTSSTSTFRTATTTTTTSVSTSTVGQACYVTSTTQTTSTIIQATVTSSTTSTTTTTTSSTSTFLTTTSSTSMSTSVTTTTTTVTVCTQTLTSTTTSTALTTFTRPATTISLLLAPGTIGLGSSVTLSGVIVQNPGAVQVTISTSQDSGSTWTTLMLLMTDSSGSYSIGWTPPYPGSFLLRARWSGNSQLAGSASASASLTVTGTVTPTPTLLLSIPSSASRGQFVTLSITVFNPTSSPLNANVTVQITGPSNYVSFDVIQIQVGASSQLTTYYDWTVPNQSGAYSVTVGLLQARPGGIDTGTIQPVTGTIQVT